jgi:hypothetical protein
MAFLTKGNAKLGPGVFHFDLPAGLTHSCPGASDFCSGASVEGFKSHGCYAQKGRFLMPSVQAKYAANMAMLGNLGELEHALALEIERPAVKVVRIHTSGDFPTVSYVAMWARLALTFPAVKFYAYTRSWTRPGLKRALESFDALPNVTLWASHDPTMAPAPADWRIARIVGDWAHAPGEAHCPEQTGKRASCTDCGLCWTARPKARLAFLVH